MEYGKLSEWIKVRSLRRIILTILIVLFVGGASCALFVVGLVTRGKADHYLAVRIEAATSVERAKTAARRPDATILPALACTLTATGSSDLSESEYPAGGVPPSNVPSLTATVAVTLAQDVDGQFGGAAAPSTAATSLEEMPYSNFETLADLPAGSNPSIASSRCVWVVTVQAAFQIPAPPGASVQTAPSYTVVFDVASEQLLTVLSKPLLSSTGSNSVP